MFTTDRRLLLQSLLEGYCDSVYFQPPADVKMSYPAVVYSRSGGSTRYADDISYNYKTQYQITYISRDPDDPAVHDIARGLPQCRHERFFIANNLNHDVFVVHF